MPQLRWLAAEHARELRTFCLNTHHFRDFVWQSGGRGRFFVLFFHQRYQSFVAWNACVSRDFFYVTLFDAVHISCLLFQVSPASLQRATSTCIAEAAY